MVGKTSTATTAEGAQAPAAADAEGAAAAEGPGLGEMIWFELRELNAAARLQAGAAALAALAAVEPDEVRANKRAYTGTLWSLASSLVPPPPQAPPQEQAVPPTPPPAADEPPKEVEG